MKSWPLLSQSHSSFYSCSFHYLLKHLLMYILKPFVSCLSFVLYFSAFSCALDFWLFHIFTRSFLIDLGKTKNRKFNISIREKNTFFQNYIKINNSEKAKNKNKQTKNPPYQQQQKKISHTHTHTKKITKIMSHSLILWHLFSNGTIPSISNWKSP